MLGAGSADFGCDPCSSDSLRGSRNFVFFCYCQVTVPLMKMVVIVVVWLRNVSEVAY